VRIWLENYVNGILDKLISQFRILSEYLGDIEKEINFKEVIEILENHKTQIEKILKRKFK